MFSAAAAFPSKVAACPQRTWAILTRYENNPDFSSWSRETGIVSRDYSPVQRYTSDLLDAYVEFKCNLSTIRNALADRAAYMPGPGDLPVNITVEDLVKERKLIKAEMDLIVAQIDSLYVVSFSWHLLS